MLKGLWNTFSQSSSTEIVYQAPLREVKLVCTHPHSLVGLFVILEDVSWPVARKGRLADDCATCFLIIPQQDHDWFQGKM